jgi:hypothetical protein
MTLSVVATSHWSTKSCSAKFERFWKAADQNVTGYNKNYLDSPLRVFLRCGKCHVPITGSHSTKRKNKRYPYYRCRENCKTASAPADQLHMSFMEWLQELTPFPEAIPAIKNTIMRVREERQGNAVVMRSVLNGWVN